MSTTKTVYTNGTSLFTLASYSAAAGVCHENGIAIHSTVTREQARVMHSNGALHYVHGIGDTVVLKGAALRRGMSIGSFEVA